MPVVSIPLKSLADVPEEQRRAWCAALEAGSILYFPETPLPIPQHDLEVLLGQKQTGSRVHKNIAYKPNRDELTGVDSSNTDANTIEELHAIMRRYSDNVEQFLTAFLAPYRRHWARDYASYRPLEEQGRDLALRKRNDLLHTDAFPTRPTRGWRILRFFHNIHPTNTRDWVVGEPFSKVVGQFTPGVLPLPRAEGGMARFGKQIAHSVGLTKLVPGWKRTPYDEFMMRLHNAMKENAAFQKNCAKEYVNFAPGSSWMVYTETVPHAVLAGQYALEQTFLVDPDAAVTPESAPLRVLEAMTGASLV